MSLSKACKLCQDAGHDSDGTHLFLMDDGKRWCCNRSEYHPDGKNYYESTDGKQRIKEDKEDDVYDNQLELHTLLMESDKQQLAVPMSTPSGNLKDVDIEYRGISIDTFRKYEVRGEYDHTGSLVALSHNMYKVGSKDILARKIRRFPKDIKMSQATGKGTKLELFGQRIFPRAKRLLITEGELDAKSAYQMLKKWKIAVVSLPMGANVKALMDNAEYLKGFKEIYISTDQDDSGKKVSRDIANLIPAAKFLTFSEKDANDMLQEHKEAEFISAFWDAEIYKPDTIIRIADVMDKVLEKPVMGTPWPWETLTEKTYGRNPGQGMYVGAGVKIGKSEFINQMITYDVMNKRKIAVLKYEEPPFMTVKRVAGKIDGIFYHQPGVTYSDADLKRTAMGMEEYLLMYPAFGQANWKSTKEFIRYAALSGCETIIIDPITKLTNHLDSSETENELRTLSDEIACMAQDMGFFYIVTCHLKAPTSGPPHERGGSVQSYQFRGSRAMMENTFYMLGIERNKDPDQSDDEINTSKFVLLEDRNFGNTAKFPVFYDKIDQSYLEKSGGGGF